MKFKNSYILLITMAIFLLVSIGSVCANDNITDESNSPLASTDNSIVLEDNTDNGLTQPKQNTTVVTDDTKEFNYNEDKNFSISVKDNESNEITVNQSELSIFEGTNPINFIYNNSIISITDSLAIGNHSLKINYLGNDNYTNSSKIILIKVLEDQTQATINCDDIIKKMDTDTISFKVNVTSPEGTLLNVTSDNLKIYNGNTLLNTEYAGSIITINDKLKYGIYNLTIKYTGNASNATKDIVLKVYTVQLITTTVSVNSTKKGEIKLNITDGKDSIDFTKEDLSLVLKCKNNNETADVTITSWSVSNGVIYFELSNLNFTTGAMNITYNNTSTVNLTINKVFKGKIIVITSENEYQNGNFTFQLVDADTNEPLAGKKLSLTITGNISTGHSTTTDENGIARFKTSSLYVYSFTNSTLSSGYLTVGSHPIELKTEGDVSTKLSMNLTITKANIVITINKYEEYYGSNKNLSFVVKNVNGEVVPGIILKLKFPKISSNYFYAATNSDGVAQISVKGVVGGTYEVTATNNDTENMVSTTKTGSMTIKKLPAKIKSSNVKMQFDTGNTLTIKTTRNGKALSGMYVLVKIYTGSKYKGYIVQTNKKGKATLAVPVNVGKHKVVISSADNRYSASKVTKKITVTKAKGKITANKVNTYYKSGKTLTIKLTNTKKKKPIHNAKLKVRFYISKTRYYSYKGYTAINGKIKIGVSGLKPGSYKVEVRGGEPKNFKASKISTKVVIKKVKPKLVAKKISAKKGANSYFKVTTKKKIVDAKIKIKVYTGSSAKTYSVKTNSKGIAKLSTKSLTTGKHKVVASLSDKYCKAKKVTSSITIK